MSDEIQIIEQQFEEIRNIILLHRTRALQNVNEESLTMSWQVGQIVSYRLKNNEWGSKEDFANNHVSFQNDSNYVNVLFERVIGH